jgi:hypothetical protein
MKITKEVFPERADAVRDYLKNHGGSLTKLAQEMGLSRFGLYQILMGNIRSEWGENELRSRFPRIIAKFPFPAR